MRLVLSKRDTPRLFSTIQASRRITKVGNHLATQDFSIGTYDEGWSDSVDELPSQCSLEITIGLGISVRSIRRLGKKLSEPRPDDICCVRLANGLGQSRANLI